MDKVLSLLGLAQKAGRVEAGEDAVSAAAEVRRARLVLLASDASENSARRARRFAERGACLWAGIPASKAELGRAVGRGECAMLAVTDIGFAEALAKKLAAADETRYAALAQRLEIKKKRALERKAKRGKK